MTLAKNLEAPESARQNSPVCPVDSFSMTPEVAAVADSAPHPARKDIAREENSPGGSHPILTSPQMKFGGERKFRKILRDAVVEVLARLPSPAQKALLRRFRRPLLWALFRIERDPFTIAPAGPPFRRFRMWLDWQGNLDFVIGNYEPEVVRSLRRTLRPGDFCLDIGANLGYYSILMAGLVGPQGLVIAFEPFPKNFQALKQNVRLNQLTNVRLEPVAVAARNGSVSMFHDPNETVSATPSFTSYALGEHRQQISVPSRSLDDYLSDVKRTPALLKIDVEGAELEVLQGARHTLGSSRPVLLLEIHGWGQPASQTVISYLDQCGYAVKVMAKKAREATVLCTGK